jgi:hypothetical protein
MTDASPTACDVVGCERRAAGTYLHMTGGATQHFAICGAHLNLMRAGQRPVVVAERLDLAGLDARPALLFEAPDADDERTHVNGSA